MNISVIVVNFHTTGLLPDLLEQCAKSPLVGEILVVHNDGSAALDTPDLRCPVLQLPASQNLGFAAAVNQGLEHATGSWILLLNPDVRLEQKCISELAHWAERLDANIVGPRFFWDDERHYRLPPATGCSAGQDCATLIAGRHPLDAALVEQQWAMRHDRFWGASKPFVEPFLSGACLLIRRAQHAGSALLDDRYFLYFEDTDLCAHAVLDGHLPVCVPSAEAVHYWNQSPAPPAAKAAHMRDSHDTFIKRFYGVVQWPQIDRSAPPDSPTAAMEAVPAQVWSEPANWLEMSPNPLMVPFVQVSLRHCERGLAGKLWSRLEAGWYYFRIRDRYGRVRARWKSEKSAGPARQPAQPQAG